MALGNRRTGAQGEFWIAVEDVARAPGHPFYTALNRVFKQYGFDAFVEERCKAFYAENGRPGIPPGVYFRCQLVGYFEGIDSERGIEWRIADSLSLREFIGVSLKESPPDHSSFTRIRQRLSLEVHEEVFAWILQLLAKEGLVKGQTIGVDGTTLEANAAMRSIVRRDTGESYRAFLTKLAKESGIATPTQEDLARLDRERKKKASNDDWQNPHDPDARITKMKDGTTHLGYKAEHATDLDTGAVLHVALHGGDAADTKTLCATIAATSETLERLAAQPELQEKVAPAVEEVVADKGYHSNEMVCACADAAVRTYISEPKRGRRNWENKSVEKQAVYANRRRITNDRGKRLLRARGEKLERPFAHCYDRGGMRRIHLRGKENILKRLLVHVGGFNLGQVMRKLVGFGTPKELPPLILPILAFLGAYWSKAVPLTRSANIKYPRMLAVA